MPTALGSIADESAPEIGDASAAFAAASDSEESTDVCDDAEPAGESNQASSADAPLVQGGQHSWKRVLAHAVLPALAMVLTLAAAYLTWRAGCLELSQAAAGQSTRAATESTIAMLSYRPDTAEKDLRAAASRLTDKFRDEYTQLISDVVIPGSKQKQISSTATVPAAASVAATENHAVVLVFVNQTIVMGGGAPTDSASSVRVTLDKVNHQWLISRFDPI